MSSGVIAVVEDDPDDLELMLRALRQGNITNPVVTLRDGVEAIDYLFRNGPDAGDEAALPVVMLLDLQLPRLGGLDVLRAVRANERTCLLPVVLLTSSREHRDVLAGYELGANSYVTKPVEFPAFARAVQGLGLYWTLMNQAVPPSSAH